MILPASSENQSLAIIHTFCAQTCVEHKGQVNQKTQEPDGMASDYSCHLEALLFLLSHEISIVITIVKIWQKLNEESYILTTKITGL